MLIILILVGIVVFPILIIVETILTKNHYRTRMAKDDLAQHDYDRAWMGRSGAGYIAVKGTKLIIFKTKENVKTFNLKKLFVFTQKTRVDFNQVYLPLTRVQRYWGVILKPEVFQDFTAWLKENHVPVLPLTQVVTDLKIALAEEQKSGSSDPKMAASSEIKAKNPPAKKS